MTSNDSFVHVSTGDRILFHIPLLIFYLCILIFGILGNVLVLYIYTKKLNIAIFGFFIKLLAMSDLITPCVAMPCLMLFRFAPHQIDTKTMCKALTFIKHFNAVNSGLIFIIIAFQRYRLICRPHGKQISENLAKKLCAVAVILSIAGSIPIIFFLCHRDVMVGERNATVPVSICDFLSSVKGDSAATAYSIWMLLELLAVILTLVITYAVIGRTLRMHANWRSQGFRPKDDSSKRNKSRAPTVIFFVLTVIFLVTASPLVIISTYFSLTTVDKHWSYSSIMIYDFGVDLLFVNCVVNPIVYSFTSGVFRTECKTVLCSWKFQRLNSMTSSQSSHQHVSESFLNS